MKRGITAETLAQRAAHLAEARVRLREMERNFPANTPARVEQMRKIHTTLHEAQQAFWEDVWKHHRAVQHPRRLNAGDREMLHQMGISAGAPRGRA